MQINYKITYQNRRKGNSKASERSLLISSLRFNCSPPRQGHLRILAEKKKKESKEIKKKKKKLPKHRLRNLQKDIKKCGLHRN